MAKIAFVVSNDPSPLISALCFARSLAARGHVVIIIGNAATAQRAADSGLPSISYGDFRQWQLDSPEFYRRQADICDQLEDIQRQGDFDLALVDAMIAFPLALGSLRAGLRVVRFSPNLGGQWSLAYPAVSWSGLPHSRRSLRLLQSIWAWALRLCFLFPKRQIVVRASRALGINYDRRFRQEFAARQVHLGVFEYGVALANLPELVAAPAALELPWLHTARRRTYIGACVDTTRSEVTVNWPALQDDRPLVYCSFGTFSHEYPHARATFAALIHYAATQPDEKFVIHFGNVELGDIAVPPNVHAAPLVPQLEMLRRASIFVTHGGLASVREACYFGVPMVVIPGWNDQYGNSARVAFHGIGITCQAKDVSAATLAAIFTAIKHPDYKRNAQRMQARVATETTGVQGAEAIERLIADWTKVRAPPTPDVISINAMSRGR